LNYYYLGVNYQSTGNKEEALKYFNSFKKIVTEDWIKNSPNDAKTYFWLSAVSARSGEMDFSRQMLLKAMKIDSTKHERIAEMTFLSIQVSLKTNNIELDFVDNCDRSELNKILTFL
jgi:tetratricopeptide (TPR) repeat protein